jgi:hypothetical protein
MRQRIHIEQSFETSWSDTRLRTEVQGIKVEEVVPTGDNCTNPLVILLIAYPPRRFLSSNT